jgi:uncharacterized membrane protein YbhN (UPF0104 family)
VLAIVLWMVLYVDWDEVLSGFRQIPTSALVLAGALTFGQAFIGALRWRAMMLACGGRNLPTILQLVRLVFVGFFYNAFIPISGDVVRGAATRKCFDEASVCVLIPFIERVLGMLALGIVVFIGLAGSSAERLGLRDSILPWAGLLTLGVLIAILALLVISRSSHRLTRLLPQVTSLLRLVEVFVWSLAGHLLAIGVIWVLTSDLETPLLFLDVWLLSALGAAAANLPVSVGGVGPREATLVGLLSLYGVSTEHGLAVSIGNASLMMLLTVIGGCLQLLPGRFARPEKETRSKDTSDTTE